MRRTHEIAQDESVTIQVPRSALTVIERPRCVSQRTSERVLGIPRRAFLDLARAYREAGGQVLAAGKLRICEIDPLLAWMREREQATAAGAESEPRDAVDTYAARLGLRAVTGGRG